VVASAIYRGELIVVGDTRVGFLAGAGDSIARLAAPVADLPPTNRDTRGGADAALLLITLTALTALAGIQLLRRA
jgi:hypothetical protein